MASNLVVQFFNGRGTGLAEEVSVTPGTVFRDFFKARMGSTARPSDYYIKLRRGSEKLQPAGSDLVQHGDFISILPAKVEGA